MIEPLLQAERLLLHGMVEQAEHIYRRVAEQDPLNSIAVVGLARVCLERGDDDGALDHARAALLIDPENAAAVRLEARLSEVLAERARRAEAPTARDEPTAAGQSPAPAEPPAWASTSPTEPSAPTPSPEARPSERAVFTRNPSMADHRRQEPEQQPPAGQIQPAADQQPAAEQQPAAGQAESSAEPERRRSLLSRLLRRRGGN